MESLDLLRKFLVTGFITIVAPQKKSQIWFGTITTLFFFVIHIRLEPFRDRMCNTVQLAAHLQLLLTYITALLFFDDLALVAKQKDDEDSFQGVMLIVANCGAFVLVLLTSVRGAHRILIEMSLRRLTWPDGRPIDLLPPSASGGYHVFLSHVWRFAQDQAGTIKSTLKGLMPACEVFLDVDDLDDISKLEQHIGNSDLILIIVTDQYLSSWNCRRELLAAFDACKPLLLLMETDTDKGATSAVQLRVEAEAIERSGAPKDHVRAATLLASIVEQATGAYSGELSHSRGKKLRGTLPPVVQ